MLLLLELSSSISCCSRLYVKQEFYRSVKNDLSNENCSFSMSDSKNSEVKTDLKNQSSFKEVYLQTLIVRNKRK